MKLSDSEEQSPSHQASASSLGADITPVVVTSEDTASAQVPTSGISLPDPGLDHDQSSQRSALLSSDAVSDVRSARNQVEFSSSVPVENLLHRNHLKVEVEDIDSSPTVFALALQNEASGAKYGIETTGDGERDSPSQCATVSPSHADEPSRQAHSSDVRVTAEKVFALEPNREVLDPEKTVTQSLSPLRATENADGAQGGYSQLAETGRSFSPVHQGFFSLSNQSQHSSPIMSRNHVEKSAPSSSVLPAAYTVPQATVFLFNAASPSLTDASTHLFSSSASLLSVKFR